MSIFNQRGNVLLFVISGIAMIAAVAMGMFYMTSSSSLGQAGGSGMNRAYFLALAGKDYALAHWNNRTSWDNTEFSVSNSETFHVSYRGEIITSTGIVNKNTSFEARKTIRALQPSFAKRHFSDTFGDLAKWATGSAAGEVGSHSITPDKALKVTGSEAAFGSGRWSFLQLKTGSGTGTALDFSPPWRDAGYCLSHDLQVKIKNDGSLYAAGMNFKVSDDGEEFYGISFLRARKISIFGSDFTDYDNIPQNLKPEAIYSPVYGVLYEESPTFWYKYQYSHPAIILWKRYWDNEKYVLTWLSYKLLTDSDHIVYDANPPMTNFLLTNWSNLQVRLNEAYPLSFLNGGPKPLLHNAVVRGEDNGATGRISGSPILESGSWEGGNAAGKLTLTNISGTFQNGENLLVNGVTRATVSGTIGDKMNFIRVYYGDMNPSHTPDPNNIPTDNNRALTARVTTGSGNVFHWPVDNVSDWNASNDNMTLVQWANQIGTGASRLGGIGTMEENAIIADSSLLTPDSGTINYSGIALHATGDTATSTYFDDFAIQY